MLYLLHPLASALIYPVGALLLKRALGLGVDSWRVTFLCNTSIGLLFLPLFFWAGPTQPQAHWWQPLLAGTTFWLGQIFTFQALSRGDASVATPLLGTKVIFVALFTVVLMQSSIPLTWWMAAGLTSLSLIFLAQNGEKTRTQHAHAATVVYSICSAFSFALTDVWSQQFTPAWGFASFGPRMFGTTALLSLLFLPFMKSSWRAVPKIAWPPLLGGASLLGAQAMNLYYVLGVYGQATAVNVVYNARGIFSVLLVWIVGHWFHNQERHVGHKVMGARLIAALLLLSAIGLILAR